MKLEHLVRFAALAEELHFPRAADKLGIPLASLYTTLDKLEEEVGQPLVQRTAPTRLLPRAPCCSKRPTGASPMRLRPRRSRRLPAAARPRPTRARVARRS